LRGKKYNHSFQTEKEDLLKRVLGVAKGQGPYEAKKKDAVCGKMQRELGIVWS